MSTAEQLYKYTVTEDQDGSRFDRFLAGELKEHSRSYIQKLMKEGRALCNGKVGKPSLRLQADDQITLRVPPLKELEVLPEDTVETLSARLMEECEWPLLSEAVSLFCARRLSVRGRRVEIRPEAEEE